MFSITKLDKRYTGYREFKYRIDFNGAISIRRLNYIQVRAWCWETFGPGLELDLYMKEIVFLDNKVKDCSWCFDYRKERSTNLCIYLKGERELSLVALKWKN